MEIEVKSIHHGQDVISKYYLGGLGTNGGQEGFIQGFGGRNMRERDNFEDVGVDGRIM